MPLTFTAENISFTVDFDRFDCENLATGAGRWNYTWAIAIDGATVATGDDLRSGSTDRDHPAGLADMLASFFTFFSAYIEAIEYADRTGREAENVDLYPAACRPIAELLDADQVSMWGDEIKGYTE